MSETSTRTKPAITKHDSYRSNNAHQADELQPTADLVDYAKSYAREKPEVAALWCLGVGFILGWKLKPW
ncbi:hypothetical protein [Adhaeretor mobilis]|uniref:Uncharacterized protein n=1 Tax=Adhaeretor mobilis TaxID=1930276 RepID=A0A517MX61_9BACT|nr:hypothetical protein [Adhaeretor mobilis]QDS99474.1 hypothetical protein HG15A2_27970 [Adhaeretor mobilis]